MVSLIFAPDFAWDPSCTIRNPSGIWYYPNYDESTCDKKDASGAGIYDAENYDKYVNKNQCCMEKFGYNVVNCCEQGDGECTMSGNILYLPDWSKHTCAERDAGLLLEWESNWVSSTMEECCNQFFEYDGKCGLDRDRLYYYPNQEISQCHQKSSSELEVWESLVFDSLHACCSEQFPHSITSCCEAGGGCDLSGITKWVPDWSNSHCYEKVGF
jgi:hypothetical protein